MASETSEKSSECSVSQEKLNNAKNYLLQTSVKSGLNLYEHLTLLLRRLLDERPDNAVDILENISKQQKKAKLDVNKLEGLSAQNVGKESSERVTEFALAEIQHKLFSKDLDDEAAADDNIESPLPNLLELFFYFEQAGVGFGREELIRIWLALKNLVDSHPLETVRFWGKIFGLEQNYIIAEAEYREGEEEESEEQAEEMREEEKEEENLGEDEEGVVDDTPKPVVIPVKLVPKEENRTGANKKSYFVCHEPGKPWIKLPSVTPQQIVVARQIKKSFTGRLDAPIISFPPFNGTEANYLRAQIARISAGTLISPAGFYKFDEEDEVEEEGIRENFVEDLEYEPKNLVELLEPSLQNWVHHVLNILPQGRCTWVNPNKKDDDEEPEEDEEEEGQVKEEVRPEIGPPLLSPLSEDISVDGTAPWSIRLSSKLIPHAAIAVVRSNLWPGAYAFAKDKKFENVYVGWGHKFSANSFGPSQPATVQEEFAQGQDLIEAEDPTPEQEAELKKAQAAGEEEEAEEEQEEEED